MRRSSPRALLAVWAGAAAVAVSPQATPSAAPQARPAPPKADAAFALTVDSIMRGPGVVGYPPSGLRWSGDSERLYFEWRPRGEDEPATWEVSRACLKSAGSGATAARACEPRRLSDEERKLAPPAGGEWDPAHRRSVGVVDGDVIVIDTVTRTRTLITRTSAAEARARWSDGGRAVTFIRDQGLYRVRVDRTPESTLTAFEQVTDAGPARPRGTAPTDSQQFLKTEEANLLTAVREADAKKAKADAKKDAQAVPRVTTGERQEVEDVVVAHEGKVAYAIVATKPAAARRADVPAYVTSSSYPENLPGRTFVGDPQETRRLIALDLAAKTETPIALDGVDPDPRAGPLLWSLPIVSGDGRFAATVAVSADNEHRYIAALAPGSGRARVIEHLRLVIGSRHVERHAVLVDGEAAELRIHHLAAGIERGLERQAARRTLRDRAVERGQEIARQRDAVFNLLARGQRIAAAGQQGLGSERLQPIERAGPVGEMRVAAVTGGAVFDQIAREHHPGVRHPRDDVASGVAAAEVDQLDPEMPDVDPLRDDQAQVERELQPAGKKDDVREWAHPARRARERVEGGAWHGK